MKNIFIGVDGGGTNCRLVIMEEDENVLYQAPDASTHQLH